MNAEEFILTAVYISHVGSRWYTPDPNKVAVDIYALFHHGTKTYVAA
jgi:hypothetical protein